MAKAAAEKNRTKYLLDEKDIPTRWYNIQADFKTPLAPPLHPGTGQPIGPQDLAPLFPIGLIKQEVSRERWNVGMGAGARQRRGCRRAPR